MADNLLSFSNVNLFGIAMDDLEITDPDKPWKVRTASRKDENIASLTGATPINGVAPDAGDFVLVWQQTTKTQNGVYRTKGGTVAWEKCPVIQGDHVVSGSDGRNLDYRKWNYSAADTFTLLPHRKSGANKRKGANRQLEDQFTPDAKFARIYGFSFEGYYYDLPRPILFLVHGDGKLVTKPSATDPLASRAPREPDITGIAAAHFDFADEMRVWSYDKGDYSIRMDVDTGMFEDVLLAAMLGSGGALESSGMNARGMNARGMNARGMNARGMNAKGMNARGNSD